MSTGLNDLITTDFTVPQATTGGPATDGASAAVHIGALTGAYVMIASTGTVSAGTILTQISNNGTDWYTVDDTQDSGNALAELVDLPQDAMFARVKCTENIAGASGVVTASVAGRKAWRQG